MNLKFDTLAIKREDHWHIFVHPANVSPPGNLGDNFYTDVMHGNSSIQDIMLKIREMVHVAGSRNR